MRQQNIAVVTLVSLCAAVQVGLCADKPASNMPPSAPVVISQPTPLTGVPMPDKPKMLLPYQTRGTMTNIGQSARPSAILLPSQNVSASVPEQRPQGVTLGVGVKAGVGGASGSVGTSGDVCGSAGVGGVGVVFCENPKTGEKSWGASTPVGSLQLGGKGSDGSSNFVKVTAGLPTPVSPQASVKVQTPCFTRSGMTTGSVKEP
jgi:hypothetical protein